MADWASGGLYRYTVAVQDELEVEDLKQKKVQMVSSHRKNPNFIIFSPNYFIYLQFSVLFHHSAGFLRLCIKSILRLLKVSHLQKTLIQVPIWSGCCFNVVLRVVPPHVCSAQHFEPRLSFLAGSECRRVLVVKLLLVALPESSAGQRNSVSPRRGTGCEEVAGNVNNPPGWGCRRLSSK